ncbi:MAG: aminodeoxychorismate synthase component I [Maricaulaceae bacterium]
MNNGSHSRNDTRLDGPFVFLDDTQTPAPRFYTNPVEIIQANEPHEIDAAFTRLKTAHEQGFYLAGFTSYELGYWLEGKLKHRLPTTRSQPLLCFGVFQDYSEDIPVELLYTASPQSLTLEPTWTEANYLNKFNCVQDYLKAGDCYQINLTFPMQGHYGGDPLALYASLRHRQAGKYGGFIRLGGPDLLSLSPELFFKKQGTHVTMRPMKGTQKRSPNTAQDNALRDSMAIDIKSQAENLMIVDLLRNDLSRLALTGSVDVPELFSLETYPTLHQMTSRVTAELKDHTTFREMFHSLFPCGSVTGAPKIRAMEIINELEDTPRGAYCGAVGYVDPHGNACFNVAIRTLSLANKKASYHVGSGIVLDSNGADEYAECLLKSDVLTQKPSYFIETLYWDYIEGYRDVGRHLNRLSKAVRDEKIMQNVLEHLVAYQPANSPARVRLTVDVGGKVSLKDEILKPIDVPLRVALSKYALTAKRQETQHKASLRDFYDGERYRLKQSHGIDEVIFTNKNSELCEGSFTSLFIEKNGKLYTPPLDAGLLPGVLRAKMLTNGDAITSVLKLNDLQTADAIYLGNSLRGLMPAKLTNIYV